MIRIIWIYNKNDINKYQMSNIKFRIFPGDYAFITPISQLNQYI